MILDQLVGSGNEPLVAPCHGFVICVDSDSDSDSGSVYMNNLQSLRHLYRHRLCNQGSMLAVDFATVGHGDVLPDEGPDVVPDEASDEASDAVLLDGAPADHSSLDSKEAETQQPVCFEQLFVVYAVSFEVGFGFGFVQGTVVLYDWTTP